MRLWTPQDVFIGALRAQRYVREVPKNSNRGPAIKAMLGVCGLEEGHPWCMAFLTWTGLACFGADWPLAPTAGCVDASVQARQRKLLGLGDVVGPGDIVLVYNEKLKRFAHVYVITGPKTAKGWPTIEGNTNDDGSREGYGVFERVRTIKSQDRVIHWWRGLI